MLTLGAHNAGDRGLRVCLRHGKVAAAIGGGNMGELPGAFSEIYPRGARSALLLSEACAALLLPFQSLDELVYAEE